FSGTGGVAMSEPLRVGDDFWSPEVEQLLDEACDRFEAACQNAALPSELPRIEDYVAKTTGPERLALLDELISLEVHYRRQQGETPEGKEYHQRFPELDLKGILRAMAADAPELTPGSVPLQQVPDPVRQPAQSEPPASDLVAVETPPQIGRYRVERILGEGGFGRVYLAHDDKLNRPVAIKVPHRKLIARPEDAETYLTEAQNAANLDHPHIVPVYDVGGTEHCPCFIVSKFIEGSSLAKGIKADRP